LNCDTFSNDLFFNFPNLTKLFLISECSPNANTISIYAFHNMRDAVKVMPSILLCWPTTLEVDAGGMAVEVEPSQQ
jgi:hypothetical protein